jgi:hypothetical protein
MSEGPAATTALHRVGSGASRLARAWRVMPHERRLAAYAAIGLFLTLFLPWYQETVVVASSSKKLETVSQSFTAWGSFSFVEAAILLVAVSVLTLLFQRAEGRAFHVPGGDGSVITAAGFWTCVLVVWRIFDKQGTSNQGQVASSSGIEWGIFVTLAVAVFLTYAGSRIRAAHQPEPPLPGDEVPPGGGLSAPDRPEPGRSAPRRRAPILPAPEQRAPLPPAPERRAPGWLTAPPAGRPGSSPDASGRERPAGSSGAERAGGSSGERSRGPERPAGSSGAHRAAGSRAERAVRQPTPVPADDPPTVRTRPADDPPTVRTRPADDPPTVRARPADGPPLPPSTPAARRQKRADEQLTIPLEPDE